MEILLKRKIEEDERRKWTVRLGDDSIAIRDIAEPIVGIIEWAQDYVSSALESSPYGSIAWAGVCLLLPVRSYSPEISMDCFKLCSCQEVAHQLMSLATAQSIQATKSTSRSS